MSRAFDTQAEYLLSLANDKHDLELGKEIQEELIKQHLETPRDTKNGFKYDPGGAVREIRAGIMRGMEELGLDMTDPSLHDTPNRYAKMLVGELFRGLSYELFPKCTWTPIDPKGSLDEMVLVRDLVVMSVCEHHLQTIDGVAHIAYIPSGRLIGLSKLARVTDFFSRRPQVQERLTQQIHAALRFILQTDDVAVIIDATHYCMKARGAMQHSSTTQTNKLSGRFLSKPELRGEFLDAIR